jgi:ParB family chromosome partitioning protein
MPRDKTMGNLALASYDDIFDVSLGNMSGERIVQIPLSELFPPEFHPFQVNDDDAMYRLAVSVKNEGVREPGIARPRAEGGYELLSGNRRKRACEIAGLSTMPVIIREIDDDHAALIMVSSNLDHRETLLPSEKAWAWRIMMETLNHSGIKGDRHSYEIMVERTGVKKNQIFRFIRLTELIAALIDLHDAGRLKFMPAVALSYLSIPEQTAVADAMEKYGIRPSHSQAERLKKLSQAGGLTSDKIDSILSEDKATAKSELPVSMRFRDYFPPTYSQKQMEAVIVSLLKKWRAGAAV